MIAIKEFNKWLKEEISKAHDDHNTKKEHELKIVLNKLKEFARMDLEMMPLILDTCVWLYGNYKRDLEEIVGDGE